MRKEFGACPFSKNQGFTLVELVMVLVLIGILAITATGLFDSKDSYLPRATADQLISRLRLAQQQSLARGTATPSNLSATISGDELTLASSSSASATLNISGLTLGWKTTATHSCGGSNSGDFTIHFNHQGFATAPDGNSTSTLICVSGGQVIPICVSALGYAYEGYCDS